MELNATFVSGFACGLCLGLSIFAFRRFRGKSIQSIKTVDSSLNSQKSGTSREGFLKKLQKVIKEDGEYKLVLVVRNDLKMGKGKIGAQCAHAAVGAYSKALEKNNDALQIWEYTGQAKIALKVETEEEMMEIYKNAKKQGLVTSLIRDAGRTQIAPNTKTVLGIGPASKSEIDKVTGHLKLLS